MAINRFWGNAQPAKYTPTTLQETALMPSLMYKREEDANAKLDAMNEASTSLKSMLGDKAPTTEQFDTQYKSVVDKMAKEGATRGNLDALRNLRATYMKEYVPIQDFAKQREVWGTEFAKSKIDNNNIILGDNPLNKSFEEYRSNPNALQFNIVKKDDLIKQGMITGKEWAKSAEKTYTDEYGRIVDQEGFSTADEALKAYDSDEKFRNWIEGQIDKQASPIGASNNPAVRDAIRSGIMASVVGDKKTSPDRMAELGLRASGKEGLGDGESLVDINPRAVGSDRPMEPIYASPAVRAGMSDAISRTSKGRYSSIDDIESKIKSIEEKTGLTFTNAPGSSRSGTSVQGDINPRMTSSEREELKSLKEYQRLAYEAVKNSPYLSTENVVTINEVSKGWQKSAMRETINEVREGIAKDTETFLTTFTNEDASRYGGASQSDRDLVKGYVDSGDNSKKMTFVGISSQYDPDKNLGTGAPLLMFNVKYKEHEKGKPETISMRLPPSLTEKGFMTMLKLSASNPRAAERMNKIYNAKNYYTETIEEPYYNNVENQ